MNIAYILRGLPGSGKSTLAKILIDGFRAKKGVFSIRIHSTDSYFVKDGKYLFDPSLLGRYHQENLKAFIRSMEWGFGDVILDNTNIKHRDYRKYVKAAEENSYQIHVITVGNPQDPEHVKQCIERNSHGVPVDVIERMSREFQF